MELRKLGEIIGLCLREALQRCKRDLQGNNEFLNAIEFIALQVRPWLGGMKRRHIAALKLGEFIAEAGEVARKARRPRLRTGAAQQRQFQRLAGGTEGVRRTAKPT